MDKDTLLQIYGTLVQELLLDTGAEIKYKGKLYLIRPSKSGEFGSRSGIEIFEMSSVEMLQDDLAA